MSEDQEENVEKYLNENVFSLTQREQMLIAATKNESDWLFIGSPTEDYDPDAIQCIYIFFYYNF